MPCCPHPSLVASPVDKLLPAGGLRLRHLPGQVCLTCHDVQAPSVRASSELKCAVSSCLAGTAPALVALKVWPRSAEQGQAVTGASCPGCGRPSEPAVLDVALGEHAGLAIEHLAGFFCWICGTGTVPNDGLELRERLKRLDTGADGVLMPSLLYDTPSHPSALQLEVTTRCNLRCAYCSNRTLARRDDVPVARVREWLDRVDMRQIDDIDFTGLGEPSLHRDLPAIVREVKARGDPSHIRMVSNGVALTRKRFEPLCEAGLTSVSFSVDSLDPVRFARSRSAAVLHQVLDNIEALVAYRDSNGLNQLRIKLKAVLVENAYAEAERLLEYSTRLGLDMPHFSRLDRRDQAATLYDEGWLHNDWDGEDSAVFLAWAHARWEELGPHPDTESHQTMPTLAQRAGGMRHALLRPPADVCRWAVDAAFVAATGNALSCCEQMIDVPRLEWGTLREATLADLWTGPLLWGYRLPLTVGVTPSRCVGCSWAPRQGAQARV